MSNLKLVRSDDLSIELHEEKGAVQAVANGLAQILADSFSLYLKTLNYHWNVEGARFVGIHKLTDEHYHLMLDAIDVIAERIRALGYYAPGSYAEYSQMTTIKDPKTGQLDATEMLLDLESDHMQLVGKLKECIDIADANHDTTTADLLSGRRNFHEEAAWMIRSLSK